MPGYGPADFGDTADPAYVNQRQTFDTQYDANRQQQADIQRQLADQQRQLNESQRNQLIFQQLALQREQEKLVTERQAFEAQVRQQQQQTPAPTSNPGNVSPTTAAAQEAVQKEIDKAGAAANVVPSPPPSMATEATPDSVVTRRSNTDQPIASSQRMVMPPSAVRPVSNPPAQQTLSTWDRVRASARALTDFYGY